ncbi:YggS family pyridoxal phosphate-dependent enzyme [Methylacidiphilum caldifontis]|uniref:Pyridoxal phosphate homeostasis protein n=1 Tax=Methylacidiphilum caldifontis TaxID=2795386 RepID=A0A4Y8PHK6_9BACT|nr:YggS family pyridoxal phosphate-dependent enzyme [Methylacidiphilum caldifontis]QSR89647.1 YggS family pyridoxal phosphate-dependent enzyme [Methylacidiphilum caldifontis]TFE73388.1 YggS family pyridoxal phosphate enzyme [Methylacidiphilum caldifontis]
MNFSFYIPSIKERLEKLQSKIETASKKSGRNPKDITIVAVTKGFGPEIIEALLQLGIIHIGENRVQEARLKKQQVGEKGIWHFIGHLQKNKIKISSHLFDWIDSVDTLEDATLLSHFAQELGKTLKILVQVNVSGESTKFGTTPEQAESLCMSINSLPRLEILGLMTIAPFVEDPEKVRPVFSRLRMLRDKIESHNGVHLPVLSMGMSQDFEVAIEEGATMIRIGTFLLGPRKGSFLKIGETQTFL